jgi:hypothetical protein
MGRQAKPAGDHPSARHGYQRDGTGQTGGAERGVSAGAGRAHCTVRCPRRKTTDNVVRVRDRAAPEPAAAWAAGPGPPPVFFLVAVAVVAAVAVAVAVAVVPVLSSIHTRTRTECVTLLPWYEESKHHFRDDGPQISHAGFASHGEQGSTWFFGLRDARHILLPELHSLRKARSFSTEGVFLSLSTSYGGFGFRGPFLRPNVFRFLASATKKTDPTKEFRSGPIRTKVSHRDQCLILL